MENRFCIIQVYQDNKKVKNAEWAGNLSTQEVGCIASEMLAAGDGNTEIRVRFTNVLLLDEPKKRAKKRK